MLRTSVANFVKKTKNIYIMGKLNEAAKVSVQAFTDGTNVVTKHSDENGAYMIDRDPKYFQPLLNYLRHGKLIIDNGISVEGVLEEAKFYSIKSVIPMLQEKSRKEPSGATKHVYRVLQCQEEELAHTISNMSDGWKFEQLLNIGSNYNYGPDEQGEYLCIVSKGIDSSSSPEATSEEVNATNIKVLQLRGT